jgi:predicted regulator of Ras-like GTPase activity (Roadblock/LC7/MglB family)
MIQTPFSSVLQSIARQRGITAVLIVNERDGIVVDGHLHVGSAEDKIAALAALLYRKARLASQAAGMGNTSFMQLEAPKGRIFAIGAGDVVLVIVASHSVNVGMVRMEMLRAVPAVEAAAGGLS